MDTPAAPAEPPPSATHMPAFIAVSRKGYPLTAYAGKILLRTSERDLRDVVENQYHFKPNEYVVFQLLAPPATRTATAKE